MCTKSGVTFVQNSVFRVHRSRDTSAISSVERKDQIFLSEPETLVLDVLKLTNKVDLVTMNIKAHRNFIASIHII